MPPPRLAPSGRAPIAPTLHALALLLSAAMAPSAALAGQDARAPDPREVPLLGVTLDPATEGWIGRDHALSLETSRPLAGGERLHVVLGHTDLTDLFRRAGGSLRYDAALAPLPSGEHDLVVYLSDDGGAWRELARRPVRVLLRGGFRRAEADPSLDLGVEGPVAASFDPVDTEPERATYQDLTGQLEVSSSLERAAWTSELTAQVVGTSHREDALRFRSRGPDAPHLDLASWSLGVRRQKASLDVGHVAFGDQKHLVQRFSSRGAVLSLRPADRVDASVAALHGSNLVGWSHLLGLDRPDHRILAADVGLELLERPGGLRLEVTAMDGSLLPVRAVNQSGLEDAETSRGLGARVRGRDASGRATLDMGWSTSRFANPDDPTLAGEDALVPVRIETARARWADASYQLLRRRPLGGTGRTADLTVAVHHERVDPLYRTVAAYTRPDVRTNRLDVRATVAGASLQASHGRTGDNLDELPSVLTTATRRSSLQLGLPLAGVLGLQDARWLPDVRASLDRTHQAGEGVPENGGFEPSHVPDQVSDDGTVSAAWRWGRVGASYRFNRSHQDNRQEGREDADLTNRAHAVTLSLQPHRRLSLDLSTDLREAEDHRLERVQDTRRWGLRANIIAGQRSRLALDVSLQDDGDDAGEREARATRIDLHWSSALPWAGAWGGTYFLRWSRSSSDVSDSRFDLDQSRENSVLQAGFGLTPF